MRLIGIAALLGAAVSLMLFLNLVRFGSQALFWNSVRNFGHVPLFGLLAVIILWLLRLTLGQRLRGIRLYFISWLGAGGIGALSEYLQIATYRDADINDWLFNVTGATVFLAFYYTFDSRLPDGEKGWQKRAKTPIRIAAFTILAIVAIPMFIGGAAHWHRQASFPELHNFDVYLERKFLEPSDATLEYVKSPDEWIGHTSRVAKVTFLPAKYPSLVIEEPYPDWRGYQALKMDVYSPVDSSLILCFSIPDCRNSSYQDRFNCEMQIQPGHNDLKIPLADIEHGPTGRLLDLSSIQRIVIFIVEPQQPLVLYFDDLALE